MIGLSCDLPAFLSRLALRFSFLVVAAGVLLLRPPLSFPAMMASLWPNWKPTRELVSHTSNDHAELCS